MMNSTHPHGNFAAQAYYAKAVAQRAAQQRMSQEPEIHNSPYNPYEAAPTSPVHHQTQPLHFQGLTQSSAKTPHHTTAFDSFTPTRTKAQTPYFGQTVEGEGQNQGNGLLNRLKNWGLTAVRVALMPVELAVLAPAKVLNWVPLINRPVRWVGDQIDNYGESKVVQAMERVTPWIVNHFPRNQEQS